jgi:acyl-CoA reductase-like NAD-dependent aldehyde dehydrogenase
LLLLLLVGQPQSSPKLTKRVTAELGNITPYIIVPGKWSEADLNYHACNVASGLAQNAGHNCIAAEVRDGVAFMAG